MAKRIYPLNSIKYWYAYDIDEICAMFKRYNLHPQTVRKWIKGGLPTIDASKPSLIYGYELKKFLGKHNKANKTATQFDEMFCMKCQDSKPIYQQKIKLEQKANFLLAKAHCQTCKSSMNKSYKMEDYTKLKSFFCAVDVLQLYDSNNSTANTHILTSARTPSNEPAIGDLFSL